MRRVAHCLRVSNILLTLVFLQGCKMPDELGYPLPGEIGWVGPNPQFRLAPSFSGSGRGTAQLLDGGNSGRSVPIAVDQSQSAFNAASLAAVPIPVGSPVGKSTLLSVSGDDSQSRVLSCTLVDLTPPFPTDDGAGTSFTARAKALVEWGVGGVQASTLLDFINGTSFTIEGSFLRVTAVLDKVGGLYGGLAQAQVNQVLGAFCGYGAVTKSNTFNAKNTIYEDQFAGGGGVFYDIPPFATNFLFYTTYGPGSVVTDVCDSGNKLLYGANWTSAANQNVPVELTGDARRIFVPGGGTIPAQGTFRIVFGMSL